jgi:SAM-dependent methyltransferase
VEYTKDNHSFWTGKKDSFTVMGDWLGRLPTVELVNPTVGLKVLDAGCGAGFVSRLLAERGAQVSGCDIAPEMLLAAQRTEAEKVMGVSYVNADITKALPYNTNFFDVVVTAGVLIHLNPVECDTFFALAHRVLRPGGRIVTSATAFDAHFCIHGDPAHTWVRHYKPGYSWGKKWGSGRSHYCREYYRNIQGDLFESNVWAHQTVSLCESLSRAHFDVSHVQTTYVTPEVLQGREGWGTAGLPAFTQVVARKK